MDEAEHNSRIEKIAEIIRLLEELKFQEKIVLGYTDKDMLALFRGKIKEIKKVVGVVVGFG